MNKLSKKFLIGLVFIFIAPAYAQDLGVVGEIYPIQEEDILVFILHRIAAMQETGEWQTLQNQFRARVERHVDRPKPVRSISKAPVTKSWNYDPSLMVPYDLKDAKGKIFAKAGTTINPLKFITIQKTLIFFDGDDQAQVKWASLINQHLSGKTKLILVNGSVSEQVKRFHQSIYFDQAGRLTTKFHIQHVPAKVAQEGFHLKISEIAL